MSTSIEQRVVQMRFDNKQFESGVAQSMSTLDKFKASLNFKGAEKGFEDISKAAENVSLAPVGNEVDKVSVKFDALQVVAIRALTRITDAAINAGSSLVKSLSVDQVTAGFSKYEQRTAAVQTLVNATGRSVEDIEGYMSKLMRYSDETSYGFGDMATALGTMVSAGGDIEKLVPLLEGFGNAVSFVGKGSGEYKRAIVQLSQGYGRNALMLEDWKPIESQLGGAKQLKEVFIEVGEELGKIKKGQISLGEFNESLRKKWLDQSVMEEALGRFAEMTERAFEMVDAGEAGSFAEAYEILSQSVDDYRIRAAKAAQEAKSFTEAVDATKDAVSSGWMETFQIIFGNYEEATRLWTDLTEVLWQVFASSAEARNELLQNWKYMGGRDQLIEAVANAWDNLYSILTNVKKAFTDVFPAPTATKLVNMTTALNKFIQSLKLSEEALTGVRIAVKVMLLPLQVAFQLLRVGVTLVGNFIKILFKLGDAFLSLPSKIGKANDPLRKIFGDERYERIAAALSSVVQKLGDAFTFLSGKITSAFKSATTFVSSRFGDAFAKLQEALTPIAEWILDRIVEGFELLANFDYSKITEWAIGAVDSLSKGFGMITSGCTTAIGAVKGFFASFKDLEAIEIIEKILDGVANLRTNLLTFVKTLGFSQIMGALRKEAVGVSEVIGKVGEAVQNMVSGMSAGKIVVFGFGASLVWVFTAIARAFEGVSAVTGAATGTLFQATATLKTLQKRLRPSAILKIAAAIAVLAISLGALSQLDPDRLKMAAVALGSVMAVFGVLVAGMAAVNKFLVGSELMAKNLLTVSTAMIAMSGSVAILAASLLMLSRVDMEGMWPKLGMLAVIMGALALVSVAVAKFAPELSTGAAFLLLFALSLGVIVNSLEKLGNADLKSVEANIGILLVIMGLLAGLSIASAHVKFGSAAGLTLFILDILLFVKVLQKISKIDVASLSQGIAMFVAMIASLIPMAIISKLAGKEMASAAGMILAMSASMIILGYAIEMIGNLDTGTIAKGTIVVAAILALFALILSVSKVAEKGSKSAGPSFMAMAASILLLGVAIKYIGDIELKKVIQGGIVVGAILTLFTILTAVANGAKGATGSIAAMAVALGLITASLVVLTLVPFEEIMGAAKALGVALIAFGAALKLAGTLKLGTAIGSILMLLAVVGSLILVTSAMKNLKIENILPVAESLALLIAALGLTMRLMSGAEFKMGPVGLAAMAAMLLEVGAVLWALDQLTTGTNMLEKAASLSLILVALGAITGGLAKLDVDVRKAAAGALAVDVVAGIILAFITAMGWLFTAWEGKVGAWFDAGAGYADKLLDLIPLITAMGVVTAALGLMAPIASGAVISAVAMDVAFALLIGFVVGVGKLFAESEKVEGYMDKGGEVLVKLAEIIGEFVGGIITGLINKVTEGFKQTAVNLSNFMEALSPFLEMVTTVGQDKLDAIKRLKEATDILGSIGFRNGEYLPEFGENLKTFGPQFKAFAESITGIETGPVYAASKLIESTATMLHSIPVEGGFFQAIFGGQDFDKFSTSLKKFAEGFKQYAEVVASSNLSQDMVERTKYATDALVNMARNIPSSGGALQSFFGEHDMGLFGQQLSNFAMGLQDFFQIITGQKEGTVAVDLKVVTNCANAGKALAEFANTIPSAGGKLQQFFGTKDIGSFGIQLATFALGLNRFFEVMTKTEIDDAAIDQAVKIGGAFRDFASTLPTDNGFLQLFTGSKDLGMFGEDIVRYGQALVDFFDSFSEAAITEADIGLVKTAGLAFTEVINGIPDYGTISKLFGSSDLAVFSVGMQHFGNGLLMFSNYAKQVDYEAVGNAIDVIADIISLGDLIEQMDENIGATFSGYLNDLASTSVDTLVTAFSDSQLRLSDAITETINNAFEAASTNFSAYTGSYTVLVDALIAGVDAHENDIVVKARAICTLFVDSVKEEWASFEEAGSFIIISLVVGIDSQIPAVEQKIIDLMDSIIRSAEQSLGISGTFSTKFQNLGKYSVEGYIKGLEDEQSRIFTKLRSLGNEILTTFQQSLGVNSPSVKFAEIAKFSILGFNQGIDDNLGLAKKTMVKMGENLLKSIKDFFGIHSPSTVTRDEVGRYIVEGIAEGITANMSAEEAAQKKAQNIINAFKSEFDKWDLQMNTANLEMELWDKLNPNAPETHRNAKQLESMNKQLSIEANLVNAAEAQYKATLQSLGADAKETQEAYNSYLEEQIKMADMSAQLANMHAVNNQAFLEYTRLLNDAYDDWIEAGMTEDEIQNWARYLSGWTDAVVPNSSVEDTMNYYRQQAGAGMDGVEVVVREGVTQAANTAYQGGRQISSSTAKGITDNSGEIEKSITNAVSNAGNKAKDEGESAGKNVWEGLVEGAHSGIGNFGDSMIELGKNGLSAFEGLFGINSPSIVMHQDGVYMVEGLANGIHASTPMAVTAVTSLASQTLNVVKAQIPQWSQIGSQMTSGLASGIASSAGAVYSAMSSVVSKTIAMTKSALQIHSPSREYYEIGQMMDQGLANGILDNTSLVTDAVTSVISAAQSAIDRNPLTMDMGISAVHNMGGGSSKGSSGYQYSNIGEFTQLLQFDANHNLIPVGYMNSGKNKEDASYWLAPSREIAEYMRKAIELGDDILKESIISSANKGVYQGTVEDLKNAIQNLANTTPSYFNYTQNINSPQPVNSATVYRNTQTQMSQFKAAVGVTPSADVKITTSPPSGSWSQQSMFK